MQEGECEQIIVEQGGISILLSVLDRFLIPIDSSESGSSGFNGLRGAAAASSLEAPVEITELQQQKLLFALYALAHLIHSKRSAWLLMACDGVDKLVHFCCSSVAYTGKNDALNVVIQALGRVAAFCTKKMWGQCMRSGVEYSFACVFLVALNDIEKQILSKSSASGAASAGLNNSKVDAGAGSVTQNACAKSKALRKSVSLSDGATSGARNEDVDGEEEDQLVVGVSIVPPELNVRTQLAPEIHFLAEEPSFFLIAQLLGTLGLILKVSPDDFTLLVAESDVMPILQTVFR